MEEEEDVWGRWDSLKGEQMLKLCGGALSWLEDSGSLCVDG